MLPVHGFVARGFERVRDAFAANCRAPRRRRRGVRGLSRRRAGRRLWAGFADLAGGRDRGRRTPSRSSSPPPRASPPPACNLLVERGRARPRRADRRLLARVRGARQGAHSRALGALATRPASPPSTASSRSPRCSRGTRSWRRSPRRRRTGSRARRTATTRGRSAGSSARSCGASPAVRSAASSPTRSRGRSASTSGSGCRPISSGDARACCRPSRCPTSPLSSGRARSRRG